jgi:hypothetical protein
VSLFHFHLLGFQDGFHVQYTKKRMMVLLLGLLLCLPPDVTAATWVVAAHNSPASAKARADIVCNGTHDEVVLKASLTKGQYIKTSYDDSAWTMAYAGQSVEWLAGDYILHNTLILPQVVDTVLHAEGTIIHYAGPVNDDVIVFSGALRSRFYFGTIWSTSSAATLAMKSRQYSNPFMPIDMNVIEFQGLQKVGATQGGPVSPGVGLLIQRPFCLNQVTGTDVRGFTTGILADESGPRDGHTIDTNWYWLSYVRGCMTAIHVMNYNINAQQWYVNVDIMNKDSVCIRTAATTEYWHIIMGTVTRDPQSRSLILDPGAAENVFDIFPPLFHFDGYENNSGVWNNVFRQVPQNPPMPMSPLTQTHLVPTYTVFTDGPLSSEQSILPDTRASTEYIKLAKLKAFFEDGLITEEEYQEEKKQVLQEMRQL